MGFSKCRRQPLRFRSSRMFFAIGVISIVVAVTVASNKVVLRSSRHLGSSLVCHVTMECVSMGRVASEHIHKNHHFECSPVTNETVSDFSYALELPDDFINKHNADLVQGTLFVTIPGGTIVGEEVVVPEDSIITSNPPPQFFNNQRRHLSVVGSRSLLVLRISAIDTTPDYSAEEIFDFIFNETKPTLKSQYNKCSAGKLDFLPSQYGVMEVYVNVTATGATSMFIRDAAITAVTTALGIASITSLADHVMFCIPPGTGNWAGSATVNYWRTVLNNKWCGYLSGMMHEMGHNLGLLHANEDGVAYRDFTSYMSAGFANPFFPVKCFNGANNWQFGWYSDRQVSIDPAGDRQLIKLATFVDYSKGNDSSPVLIKIGNETFLQYNRAKDFNFEPLIMIDQITIVQQQHNGTALLGGINASSPLLVLPNFEGSGQDVVLYVCDSGLGVGNESDWISLSIAGTNNNNTNCSPISTRQPSATPTPQPTPKPTTSVAPSHTPSKKPVTKSPTVSPTVQSFNLTTIPINTTINLTTISINTTINLATIPINTTINLTTIPNNTTINVTTIPINTTVNLTTIPINTTVNLTTIPINTTSLLSTASTDTPTGILPVSNETFSQNHSVSSYPTSAPVVSPIPSNQTFGTSPRTFATLQPTVVRPQVTTQPSTSNPTLPQTPSPSGAPSLHSNCLDNSTAVFFVGSTQRNCAWLSLRPSIWHRECMPGKPASEYCNGVCRTCSQGNADGATASLDLTFSTNTIFPGARQGPDLLSTNKCNDSLAFQISVKDVKGNVTCTNLRARPKLRVQLCTRPRIQNACPETCGICNYCVDQSGNFSDNDGVQRTCLWLSMRYRSWATYCRPGQVPFSLCPKTCDTCSSMS